MKTVFKSLPLLLICSLFAFAACAGDTYDNAALNISINDSRVRAAALAIDVEEIDHQIVLTGPTGTILTYNITGAGNVSASVTAGTWRIDVTGYYGEELYSQGTASVAVKAGQSNSVSVLMNVVWQEGGFIPTGSDLPQLPGTAYINGDNWFKTPTTNSLFITPDPILVHYVDPTWDSADPTIKISPKEGFIVDWYVGGQLVQTDTDVYLPPTTSTIPPSYRELAGYKFELIPEYWNRDVFVIVRHGDYNGVKSNNLRICKPIATAGAMSDDWNRFITGTDPDFEWEGNSFILTIPIPPFVTSPLGSISQPFNGYFDGNGHTIPLSMTLTTFPSDDCAGLFARIGPRGTVMNITLTCEIDATPVSGDCFVGGVAGINEGTIMNIAYYDGFSSLLNAYGSSYSDKNYAGGIAGYNKGIIKNCFVDILHTISAEDGSSSYAGGIAGLNEGEIDFCWVSVDAASTIISAYHGAGGIAGRNEKTINHCVVLGGKILQEVGTNGSGRIWGTGNGTGRANYANDQNDLNTSPLQLWHHPPTSSYIQFLVDYTDNRTDSKHGKGVFYDYMGGPMFTSDDASLQNWWMYTAGWDAVWFLFPLVSSPSFDMNFERPWKWSSLSSAPFYPVIPF